MIGTTIAQYRIVEKIGEGGMGVVFKAEDSKLRRPVALKFLPAGATESSSAKARFLREAQAVSALEHPNLCTIYEINETEQGQTFIAMAYYEGATLKDRIKQGPVRVTEALDITRQIVQGLALAHEHQIVHRDIKPANIILTRSGVVKIVDFGVAKLTNQTQLTRAGATVGTIAYMSPEQARGSEVDPRSDIWSLGAVLHEMITGRPPFRGGHEQAVIYKILNEQPDLKSLYEFTHPAVIAVIERCLQKPLFRRYQNIKDVTVDLDQFGVVAQGPTTPAPLKSLDDTAETLVDTNSRSLPFSRVLDSMLEEGPKRTVVAREEQLARLKAMFDAAYAGEGSIGFVSGEAGTGKTTLVQELSRQLLDVYPDLIMVGGNCNAQTGLGDPYLPFREILNLISGDVEAGYAAGAITKEHARRLWNLLPISVEALVQEAPQLIDSFVPGQALIDRAQAFVPTRTGWLTQLEELVGNKAEADPAALQEGTVLDQYTRFLQALARHRPLLVILDDLHWADAGSTNLLFHLGRRLKGVRLLILGTFRPADLAQTQSEERHPLERVINELKRVFGDNEVELSTAHGQTFVDALLDSEPNLLSKPFRKHLFHQTHGHPLFTVELLRDMEEQGLLIRDEENRLREGDNLNWDSLPARVEGVIGERIGRLSAELREILATCAVQGEEFVAEAVAEMLGKDRKELIRTLSRELDKQHLLVAAQGIERIGSQRISHYKFQHVLFQKYLYQQFDEVERSLLHEEAGQILEDLFADASNKIALQLARHFEQAGLHQKALHYLLQAGQRSIQLSATSEAIAHLSKGLEILSASEKSPERDQQELTFQTHLGTALITARGYAAPEVESTFARAQQLCDRLPDSPEQFWILVGLELFKMVRGECDEALLLSQRLVEFADAQESQSQVGAAHHQLGTVQFFRGEFGAALENFERILSLRGEDDGAFRRFTGSDLKVMTLSLSSLTLWHLGHPQRAREMSCDAIDLGRKIEHPHSLVVALVFAGAELHHYFHEAEQVLAVANEIIEISEEFGFALWQGQGLLYRDWAEVLIAAGKGTEIDSITSSPAVVAKRMGELMAQVQSTGATLANLYFASLLIDVLMAQGSLEQALSEVNKSLAISEHSQDRFWAAELLRQRGDLLYANSADQGVAEKDFLRAIEVAQAQGSKALELRAAQRLAELWQEQELGDKARALLSATVEKFSQEAESQDLASARKFLGS
jgi:serine/threonine protein kinase/tetratricopeptide (TPR) repeat protein